MSRKTGNISVSQEIEKIVRRELRKHKILSAEYPERTNLVYECQRHWQRAKKKLRDPAKWKPFLKRVTRNYLTDLIKRLLRSREITYQARPLEESFVGVPSQIKDTDLRLDIDTAVKELPDELRATYRLIYEQGLSHEETAKELGCTLKTIYNRLKKIHQLIKKKLRGYQK